MSVTSFIGFDDVILSHSGEFDIKAHRIISGMLVFNMALFFLGVYQFFTISVKDNWLLFAILIIMTYVFLAFTRMIVATHDHDLPYFHHRKKLQDFKPNISLVMRLLIVTMFALLAGTGFLLWMSKGLIAEVIARLQSGTYDHQPEIFQALSIHDNNYEMLDNITDRLKILRFVLGPWRYLMCIPYLIVTFIMLLPFMLKMALHSLSNGNYELSETEIESEMVISQYEYHWNIVNLIRKEKYGLPPIRYESHYDPPFNNIRRTPPLDITLPH